MFKIILPKIKNAFLIIKTFFSNNFSRNTKIIQKFPDNKGSINVYNDTDHSNKNIPNEKYVPKINEQISKRLDNTDFFIGTIFDGNMLYMEEFHANKISSKMAIEKLFPFKELDNEKLLPYTNPELKNKVSLIKQKIQKALENLIITKNKEDFKQDLKELRKKFNSLFKD